MLWLWIIALLVSASVIACGCLLVRAERRLLQAIRDVKSGFVWHGASSEGGSWTAWAIEECKLSRDYCETLEMRLRKSLEFYQKLESRTPKDDKWKLVQRFGGGLEELGLVRVMSVPEEDSANS